MQYCIISKVSVERWCFIHQIQPSKKFFIIYSAQFVPHEQITFNNYYNGIKIF